DNEETREALARCLMDVGRPEEAEPLLAHIIEKAIPDRINDLFRLAQLYQAKGQHTKATVMYAHCEAINPLVGKNDDFIRLRDASARHAVGQRPIKPGVILQKAKISASRMKPATSTLL